jgi:hypothetical protein
VHELKAKGVALKATEQPVDTGTAAGKAFLDMLGVFAEFETNLRRERFEGIAAAKVRGVYKGRKPSIDPDEVRRLRHDEKLGPAAIARRLGIERASVYRVLGKQVTGAANGMAMPIRPEMRWFYPIDWPQLSRLVRKRGLCQGCDRPHGKTIRCLQDGRWFDIDQHIWRDDRGRAASWPDVVEQHGYGIPVSCSPRRISITIRSNTGRGTLRAFVSAAT